MPVLLLVITVTALLSMNRPAVGGGDRPAANGDHASLPFQPTDPKSIKGRVELKVESGLVDFGPLLLFGLLAASGFGLAMGEDLFTIPAGFLMQRDIMPFWWTIAAAYFGVVVADVLWVIIVRRFSRQILRFKFFRKMFHPRHILEIKYKFDRWGSWVVVVSRFIPFSRTPVFTAAGLTRMPLGKFILAETVSALPVVGLQLGVGWLLAMGISMSSSRRIVEDLVVLGVILLAAFVTIGFLRRRRRRRARPPRVPVAWLREVIGTPASRKPRKPIVT